MDENKIHNLQGNFAITNVEKYPVSFDQYMSEAPTSVKGTVLTPRVQPTRKSPAVNINRSAVIGSFWLNPPHREPVIRISTIYKALYEMAFNYDRTHYDSFFDAYPELYLCNDTDSRAQKPSTSQLKADVKKLCKRVAHHIFYYETGYTCYLAALLNMLIMTRYDGAVPFKDLATHFKWSRINSYTGTFNRWWAPAGLVDYMSQKTAFAAGQTTYGADILAFPIWITDIFGSRGAQAPAWLNSISVDSTDADHHLFGGKDVPTSARSLIENSFRIYQQYGSAQFGDVPPNSPYIENGETVFIKPDGAPNKQGTYYTNRHGFGPGFQATQVPYHTSGWDNIKDNYWNALIWWENWLSDNFPQFKDPNSDFVELFTNQIKILEKGRPVIDLLNVVRANKNYSVNELLKDMTYKYDNKPSTNGFIRLSLPVQRDLDSGARYKYMADDVFAENYERYDVDEFQTSIIIQDAKKWPSLTPSAFNIPDTQNNTDNIAYPVVPDAHHSFGYNISPKKSYAAPLTGIVASWFDLACGASLTPEDTNLTAIGISANAAEQYVKDASGIIFEEDPSKLFIVNARLIDNTDIYQCGFNVMIASQDTDSEWDKYFRTLSNYDTTDNALFTSDVTGIFAGNVKIPKYPARVESNQISYGLHTSEADYLDILGHALVFVGQGILNHPVLMNSYKQSGNMMQPTSVDLFDSGDALTKFKAYLATAKIGSSIDDASMCKLIASIHAYSGLTLPNDFHNQQISEVLGSSESLTIIDALDDTGKGTTDYTIYDIAFNPAYGPVAISLAVNPLDDLSDVYPSLKSSSDVDDSEYSAVELGLPGLTNPESLFDVTSGSDVQQKFSGGPRFRMNGFMESFSFRPVSGNLGRTRPSTKQNVGRIVMSGISSWVLSLMSKATISFPGIEDLKSFWNFISDAKLDLQDTSPTNPTMPENNIISEPRLPNSIVRNQKSNNRVSNGDRKPAVNPRSVEEGSFKSNKRARRRNNKRTSKETSKSFNRDEKPKEDEMFVSPNASSGSTGDAVPRETFASKESNKKFKDKALSRDSRDNEKLMI